METCSRCKDIIFNFEQNFYIETYKNKQRKQVCKECMLKYDKVLKYLYYKRIDGMGLA